MTRESILFSLLLMCLFTACTEPQETTKAPTEETISNPTNRVTLSSEIKWEKLNPARGDKSPQAGTVWGNRKGEEATGFLAKFVDGFSSPPHIHNVTYRAVVIKGLVHNDDQNAEKMWMPPGSFWTQPVGQAHITAAKGEENIAYVEIDSGPYLVKPTEEAFDNGERPVNVDKSNILWLDASQTNLIETSPSSEEVQLAFLWRTAQMAGYFVKLPPGFDGQIVSDGEVFHAIVVTGEPKYAMPNSNQIASLDPTSHFSSTGKSIHSIAIDEEEEAIIYIRTNGEIRIR
ncbi:MAG: DUF4437 domain-containing protein [Bacteroidota bacterium]